MPLCGGFQLSQHIVFMIADGQMEKLRLCTLPERSDDALSLPLPARENIRPLRLPAPAPMAGKKKKEQSFNLSLLVTWNPKPSRSIPMMAV